MTSVQINEAVKNWEFKKIGVIGPGIVGMPMAALLADSFLKDAGNNKGEVVVVQRNSQFSGWKVQAINSGKSVIGGIEPGLNKIVSTCVSAGTLRATHDCSELTDADAILVCIQTDKKNLEPDYGPLFSGLNDLAEQLTKKPKDKIPLVILESTLAPSTMHTLIKPLFAKYSLEDGKDILIGNSPNRVMPGRLVDRIRNSHKIVAGLNPLTPHLIKKLYSRIVDANLLITNSLTAEVVKTLENAYRDVRIAFSSEVVRYCDERNLDFYFLRDEINQRINQADSASKNPNEVPTGGILIPTLGVGGHCLPKDGILLWWRMLENGIDNSSSIILNSRKINDQSPVETIKLAEKIAGSLNGKKICLLGAAYRFNSEDTRNSPTLNLAKILLTKGCNVKIHDPFVKHDDQNILKFNLSNNFTNDFDYALNQAEIIFVCTAHQLYLEKVEQLKKIKGDSICLVDACNIFKKNEFKDSKFKFTGIGKGKIKPDNSLIDYFYNSFRTLEKGFANEIQQITDYLNLNYANDDFNKVKFEEVQMLAGSCSTGCEIVKPQSIDFHEDYYGYKPQLTECAEKTWGKISVN